MKTLLSTTAALLTLAALAAPAQADSLEHIDRNAVSLQNQAASICWEIRREFGHDSHYGHLYRDAYAMYRAASHIHEVAHHGHTSRAVMRDLRRDAAILDSKMHHIRGVVADMRRDLSRHRRVWGHGGHRPHVDLHVGNGFSIHLGGHGGHHGSVDWHTEDDLSALRSLERNLTSMARGIHHLQKDLR